METGSNKSLFTLIAVVIFGLFLSLSYWLFSDEMMYHHTICGNM